MQHLQAALQAGLAHGQVGGSTTKQGYLGCGVYARQHLQAALQAGLVRGQVGGQRGGLLLRGRRRLRRARARGRALRQEVLLQQLLLQRHLQRLRRP